MDNLMYKIVEKILPYILVFDDFDSLVVSFYFKLK